MIYMEKKKKWVRKDIFVYIVIRYMMGILPKKEKRKNILIRMMLDI